MKNILLLLALLCVARADDAIPPAKPEPASRDTQVLLRYFPKGADAITNAEQAFALLKKRLPLKQGLFKHVKCGMPEVSHAMDRQILSVYSVNPVRGTKATDVIQ